MKWRFLPIALLAVLILAGYAATVQYTVSAVTIVQSQSETNTVSTNGTQCVWPPGGQAIRPGDTVVGFGHTSNLTDNGERLVQSVADNAGNTYNLTPRVNWLPWSDPTSAVSI